MLAVTYPNREMPMSSMGSARQVDFAAYLLAASPPGVDFFALKDKFTFNSEKPSTRCKMVPKLPDDKPLESSYKNTTCSIPNGLRLGCSPVISCRVRDRKKKVCFADDLGFDLVTIRIMKESSDTPPVIKPELLASLSAGEDPSTTETCPLKLNFSQPAADYLQFRENLDKNKISLENVILRGNRVGGTIKLVNLAFDKKVVVRHTVDNWSTHTDSIASYVQTGQSGPGNIYDTFSFEFEVPRESNNNARVLFCLCYEVNNQQYWDNNNDKNYEILPAEITNKLQVNLSQLTISSGGFDEQASEYSAWSGMDTNIPYW